MSLAIATGLWICERFRLVDSDRRPLQFLEAAWAGTISRSYCHYAEIDDDEWRSPARGPLGMTISIVNDAIFHINEDSKVAMRAVWMNSLARHVLLAERPSKAQCVRYLRGPALRGPYRGRKQLQVFAVTRNRIVEERFPRRAAKFA